MSAKDRLIRHLTTCCRITSQGDAVVSEKGIRELPPLLGVNKRVLTKRVLQSLQRFGIRRGEYNVEAIHVILKVMGVDIADEAWLPGIRAHLNNTTDTAQPRIPLQPPTCTDIVLVEPVQSGGAVAETTDLVTLLRSRDEEIKTLKEKLVDTRAELRNVQRRLDRLQRRSEEMIQRQCPNNEALAITKTRAGRNFTESSTLAISIRRNFGNVAAADLGAILLTDMSRQTVVRAELIASAALLGSAAAFWKTEQEQFNEHRDWGFSVTSFTSDATGAGMWKRKKVSTCEMESTLLVYDDNGGRELVSMKRQCDLVSVKDCTALGTLGVLAKHFTSVRAPSWRDAPSSEHCVRVWLYTSDRGPDQTAVRKLMHYEIAEIPNVLFFDFDCTEHALHLVIKGSVQLADKCLMSAGKGFKYFPALTKITQCWRDSAQEMRDTWVTMFGEEAARKHASTLAPQCVAGRWGSIYATEKLFINAGLDRMHSAMTYITANKNNKKETTSSVADQRLHAIDEVAFDEMIAFRDKNVSVAERFHHRDCRPIL